MGELSESLKNVSLGSILVVVGIISILTLVIYWYVFSEDPASIPYVNSAQTSPHQDIKPAPAPPRTSSEAVQKEPDDRVVIVETPSSKGGIAAAAPGNSSSRSEAPRPGVADDSGSLSIQLGAFSKSQGTEKLASQLNDKGFAGSVRSANGMFRVFVGTFPNRQKAEEMQTRLKASGFSGYIRSLP